MTISFHGNISVSEETILATAPSALEAHLGYWLRRVSNEVSATFARSLDANDVSVAEWVALRLLHGEPRRTAGDLAGLTGLTRGAVSKIVDKLEQKGLVARTANPADSRAQWLGLTRRGAGLVPRLAALADANDAQFFGVLAARERAELRRLLEKLAEAHGLVDVPVT